jgi:hypothetical protein
MGLGRTETPTPDFHVSYVDDIHYDEHGNFHQTMVFPGLELLDDVNAFYTAMLPELFAEFPDDADRKAALAAIRSTQGPAQSYLYAETLFDRLAAARQSILNTPKRGRVASQNGATRMSSTPRLQPIIPLEVSANVTPPNLMEGATYDAHLHNLEQIGLDAERAKTTAELTLSAAVQAQHRATKAVEAVELMAQGLAAQDFGEQHVANMNTLQELFAIQARHAETAVKAATASLDASEQADTTCHAAVAAFRRDHGQLAEAYQSAPHPAKSREAYQPM